MNTPADARPILDDAGIGALRLALDPYTVAAVHERLGLAGQAALSRGDLDAARRCCPPEDGLATLVRLFMLGCDADDAAAREALAPLSVEQAAAAGLIECSGGAVRAAHDLRPYAGGGDGEPWWVLSDLGSDVRPGPLRGDHVLGIGAASLTLARAVPHELPVHRALDIGTGCGVQALHLATSAAAVVATDISERALRCAATTAALSGQHWELRRGSLFEPVQGESFDLVVANPPFVLSPGRSGTDTGYDYRDSGLAGDGVTEALVTGLPQMLASRGTAQLLGNWAITADVDWQERVGAWLRGSACDVWVWQREVADPGEYASMWLRDAGEVPGTRRFSTRYDAWLDWFDHEGIIAVGMGLITMRRTERASPIQVLEDVRQAVEQPIGSDIASWFERQAWLAELSNDALLDEHLTHTRSLVRTRDDLAAVGGWSTARQVLRQANGLRWEIEVDDQIVALVAGCTGQAPLRIILDLLASALRVDVEDVLDAALPVVRDLISRGFLDRSAQGPG